MFDRPGLSLALLLIPPSVFVSTDMTSTVSAICFLSKINISVISISLSEVVPKSDLGLIDISSERCRGSILI